MPHDPHPIPPSPQVSPRHPGLEVVLAVAVSEHGEVRVSVAESNLMRLRAQHAQFMEDLRSSKTFWSVKTIRVEVPLPVSFVDLRELHKRPTSSSDLGDPIKGTPYTFPPRKD